VTGDPTGDGGDTGDAGNIGETGDTSDDRVGGLGGGEGEGRTSAEGSQESRFGPDPERVRLLRAVADDVRGESSESQQLAAVLYRVSDLYDADEEATPESIYRNVRFIMQVVEQGGLDR
jgi:hypothetical protein